MNIMNISRECVSSKHNNTICNPQLQIHLNRALLYLSKKIPQFSMWIETVKDDYPRCWEFQVEQQLMLVNIYKLKEKLSIINWKTWKGKTDKRCPTDKVSCLDYLYVLSFFHLCYRLPSINQSCKQLLKFQIKHPNIFISISLGFLSSITYFLTSFP